MKVARLVAAKDTFFVYLNLTLFKNLTYNIIHVDRKRKSGGRERYQPEGGSPGGRGHQPIQLQLYE
jgi:hypothetical protein